MVRDFFTKTGKIDHLVVALGIFAAFVHWPIRGRPVRRVAAETI